MHKQGKRPLSCFTPPIIPHFVPSFFFFYSSFIIKENPIMQFINNYSHTINYLQHVAFYFKEMQYLIIGRSLFLLRYKYNPEDEVARSVRQQKLSKYYSLLHNTNKLLY